MPVYTIPDSPPAIVIIKNDGIRTPRSNGEGIYLIPWCPVGYIPDHGAVHIPFGAPDYPDKIHNIIADTKCLPSKKSIKLDPSYCSGDSTNCTCIDGHKQCREVIRNPNPFTSYRK